MSPRIEKFLVMIRGLIHKVFSEIGIHSANVVMFLSLSKKKTNKIMFLLILMAVC